VSREIRLNELKKENRMGCKDIDPIYYVEGLIDFINFFDIKNKKGVEEGSYLGVSTEVFALFNNQITSVDPHQNQQVYSKFLERIKSYPNIKSVKDLSQNFIRAIPDDSLDFVYIDSIHHYKHMMEVMPLWRVKIKQGGIMCGHDYSDIWPGVIKAVDELAESKVETFLDSSWGYKVSKNKY